MLAFGLGNPVLNVWWSWSPKTCRRFREGVSPSFCPWYRRHDTMSSWLLIPVPTLVRMNLHLIIVPLCFLTNWLSVRESCERTQPCSYFISFMYSVHIVYRFGGLCVSLVTLEKNLEFHICVRCDHTTHWGRRPKKLKRIYRVELTHTRTSLKFKVCTEADFLNE